MPVWGLAKKSVRVFLNFSFGQFFSQPLSDDQVVVTSKGVGCKDIYFNIKKINAILAERGIPLVLCVAYISELIISLPWSIELNGVDFVVQASPDGCRPTEDDALLNSMISSMTAAAFAAAKVADGSSTWFQNQGDGFSDEDDEDSDDGDENTSPNDEAGKSSGLISRVQHLFERLTKTAEDASCDKNKPDPIVDQDSKERVVYMIDSLIAQTTIVLRNVSLRIECQLGLPGLNRASGITLCFQYMSLANQSSVGQSHGGGIQRDESDGRGSKDAHGKSGSQSDVNPSVSNVGWSWIWPFGYSRKKARDTTETPRVQTFTASGSLSTMLHKIIRLEGADVLWDLWDSTPKRDDSRKRWCNSRASASGSDAESIRDFIRDRPVPDAEFSEDPDGELEAPIAGPTEENMVASAKLLTIPGGEHTARVSMRCPLLALAVRSTAGQDTAVSSRVPSTYLTPALNDSSSSSTDPWSSFELRVHLDVGPIVGCVCPTQFYWLHLTIGQLNHICNLYRNNSRIRVSSPQPVDQRDILSHTVNAIDSEESRWHPEDHQVLPYEECVSDHPSESDLVNLDLSAPEDEFGTRSRAFVDSKLYWSCVTDSPEDVFNGESCFKQNNHCSNTSESKLDQCGSGPSPIADPKFSLSANVLCCALVIFYEDEPVSKVDESLAFPTSMSAGSPPSGGTGLFRRSGMLRSSIFESTRSNTVLSDSEKEDGPDSDITAKAEASTTAESKFISSKTNMTTSTTSCELAALPGPFEFFARFHGLRPWRQPQPSGSPTPPESFKRSRSTATLSGATSFAQLTSPMRIDRYEVDTGQMTPSLWVSHLRRQFAELASPRNHMCFVGGLWHVEFCSRSLIAPSAHGPCSIQGSSTEFSAQLFGLELSECLFPDPLVESPSVLEPMIYEIISFPDRFRGSGDRVNRGVSDQTAVKLSGMVHCTSTSYPLTRDRHLPDHRPWTAASCWSQLKSQPSTVLSGLVEMACCRIDVDLSLTDRVHRITDAVTAASEAVSKLTVWSFSDSTRCSPDWRGTRTGGNDPGFCSGLLDGADEQPRPWHQPFSSCEADVLSYSGDVRRTQFVSGSRNGLTNQVDVKLFCIGCEILLRFPIPLEAVKLKESQQLSDLRKTLWNTGTPIWFCPSDLSPLEFDSRNPEKQTQPGAVGLAWWRRNLRPEYLRIGLEKVSFRYSNGQKSDSDNAANLSVFDSSSAAARPQFESHISEAAQRKDVKGLQESDVDPQIELSLRSVIVHWFHGRCKVQSPPLIHLSAANHVPADLITVVLRLTPPGRTDLIEEPTDPRVKVVDCIPSEQVYTYSQQRQQRFEIGVDLANSANASTGTSAVEWSLWKRTGPKQNMRTPFVIRRHFLQDAPKMHSKQVTYYPGDANHLKVFRESASLHTRLHIRCSVPVFLVQVENKRTMELTYTRLMYDFLLWNSLLPNDRRLRATLTRNNRVDSGTASSKLCSFDHCHWFLSDPAPLASIYAHPEAARKAAALEAAALEAVARKAAIREADNSSASGRKYGLHFHPVCSDDEDDDGDDTLGDMENPELNDDVLFNFDAGLDAVPENPGKTVRRTGRMQSPNQGTKGSRSRSRVRITSDDSDDPDPLADGGTGVRRHSTCTVQIDCTNFEARFTLPSQRVANGKPDLVRVVATSGTVFAELGHDGAPNVNFFTTELGKLEVLCCPGSGENNATNEGTGDYELNWWPCLLRLSWHSIGYPTTQTLGFNCDPSAYDGSEPMFTMAVEHRQSQRSHPASGVPVYRDDIVLSVRLQNSLFAHWPNLEPILDTGSSSAGLPNWLTKLLLLLETPPTPVVTLLWPSYQLTDALLIQHIHLEQSLFTWSSTEVDPNVPNPYSYVIPSLRAVRALIGCESISVTVNTASDALLTVVENAAIANGNPATCIRPSTTTPPPGMLIMSFMSNAAMFIYPTPRTVPPGLEHLQSMSGNSTTNSPCGFLKWLNAIKITDCVCVADLDHMELRCFSDPMRNPTSDPKRPSYLTRIDVRFTNNLLRLHTCADSLAALQILIQSLSPSDSRSVSRGQTTSQVDNDKPGVGGSKVESPSRLMTKGGPRFGSHSSLHSSSPHHMDYKSSVEYHKTSGSGSSVEDLLQGAISDAESSNSSRKADGFDTKRASKAYASVTPVSQPGSHGVSEPNHCGSHLFPKSPSSGLYPRWDYDEFTQTDRTPSPAPHLSPSSSNSSPTEFVVVKPCMIPARAMNPLGSRDHIRCLISCPSTDPSESVHPTGSSLDSLGFEMRENHYPVPSGLSTSSGTRNRTNRLFTDPPSVYPRANMAVTLYNFSLEWNTYGGFDLTQTSSTGSCTDQFRSIAHSNQSHTPEHKHPRLNSCGPGPTTVGSPDGRLLSARGGTDVGSGASKIAGLQPGVRFRHDRPVSSVMANPVSAFGPSINVGVTVAAAMSPSVATTTGSGTTGHIPVRGHEQSSVKVSSQELYTHGGRDRDTSKCISLRLNKLYFRHSTFPGRGHRNLRGNELSPCSDRPPSGDPASRFVLSVGSLVILDRVTSSRINQLLYTFNPSASNGSVVPHSTDTPLLRAALVCWRVPIDTESASNATSPHPYTEADSRDLELEAKISVQPLKINVDQNTLLFIEEFQQLFSGFSVASADIIESTVGTTSQPTRELCPPQSYSITSSAEAEKAESTGSKVVFNPEIRLEDNGSSSDGHPPLSERPSIFIRKVTFYPDLPIRLDYHGRHLDFSAGSFQGFCRMLLQLNNAELVIPRRVYQRGYPNLERLLEEVMADLRVTVAAQLPQLFCTGLGPMHEVRLFLLGLWDLVYQPVQSVYQGTRDSSRVREAQWPATEWDLSTCDFSVGATDVSRRSSGGAGGFIQGLRRGTRSFSTSTLWATLQLSIQSVRVVQSIAETAYDLVTPGPALRSRQLRLRQPADLREGFGNAVSAMTRGFQMVSEDLCGATRLQSEVDFGYKGPVGMVGDVLRQIPPTIVAPVVAGCEVAANILGGFRNQLRPEAKIEDEQKWKDTHGL